MEYDIVSGGEPLQGPAPRTRRFPWWLVLAAGVVIALAGFGLMTWPFVTASWILVVLLGTALIANGIGLLVRTRPSGASTAIGILLIVVGVAAMVFSELTVNVLVVFVGIVLLALGAFWLAIGARLGGGGSGIVLLPAIMLIIGGAVTLIWPEFALSIVAVLGGFLTLLLGISVIVTALGLRRLKISTTSMPLR